MCKYTKTDDRSKKIIHEIEHIITVDARYHYLQICKNTILLEWTALQYPLRYVTEE